MGVDNTQYYRTRFASRDFFLHHLNHQRVFMNLIVAIGGFLLTFIYSTGLANGAHGLSIDGNLKYGADFTRFDYTSPDAVKGGELVLHSLGSFDKMNPFTLKGTAPEGLERFVFEPLSVSSLDEPFAQYGLLAKDIEIARDNLSVSFSINEMARFSDGSPVRAEDVKFTIDTLKGEQAHPRYPYYYADISSAEVVAANRVTIHFKKKNRELPLIVGQIRVLSKAFYEKHGFDNRDMVAPIGSGPYVVESFRQGKSITYRRNPNYWAIGHPARNKMYNFDKIKIKYYKDQTVAVEAFKAGEFDVMLVNIAKQWVRDIKGDKVDSGRIVKRKFPHRNNAGMQAFVMNTRREIFREPAVRRAIGLAFDFEYTNQTLFYGQYSRSNSFFSNSNLAATGLPSRDELRLLEPFKADLPPELFSTPMSPPTTSGKNNIRQNLRQAVLLLKEQGYELKDGVMQNGAGIRLEFEIILVSPSFERVMANFAKNLKRIGIEARYRTIDQALYEERMINFDFDMTVDVMPQSLSPGNEQRNFWHSEAAKRNGSRNLAGIDNPAVDYLVEKIIYAGSRDELITACKALDRVLWYGYYVVPNWYLDGHRLAYHNKFNIPETIPTYYYYTSFLDTWWSR
jgi:microcin C transport system substrate-binding protein